MKARTGNLWVTSALVLAGVLSMAGCDGSASNDTTDTLDAVADHGSGDVPVADDPGPGADMAQPDTAGDVPVQDDVPGEDLPPQDNPVADTNLPEATEDVPVADVTPDTPDSDLPIAPLEIEGKYTDGWGGTHEVTSQTWTMDGTGVFQIAEYDNDGNWLVAQNDAANAYNPGLWSRMDWTVHESTLYFCQTAYAAASQQAAKDTPAADATDPATTGCGGFAWSTLTLQP